MATELDPQRLQLSDELSRHVMPWIVAKAFGMTEVQAGINEIGAEKDTLMQTMEERADQFVVTAGPEFEALYRLALGNDGQLDKQALDRELSRDEWPIRWGVYYERRTNRSAPRTLYEAMRDWCTIVLRDGVMPELRRDINAWLSGEFSTTLRIGAVPGLQQANDVSFAVNTTSMRRFDRTIARTHGNGAICLAGPRGSGKSTLINNYVAKLPSTGGLRPLALVATCPVQYEARDFVLHLYASLCRSVLGLIDTGNRAKARNPYLFGTVRYLLSTFMRAGISVAAGVAALLVIGRVDLTRPVWPQLRNPPTSLDWWMFPLVLVVAYVLMSVVITAIRVTRRLLLLALGSIGSVGRLFAVGERDSYRFRRRRRDESVDELEQLARDRLRQIRVLQTSTTGWSGTLTLPFSSAASATKSIQLAERPLTYPEVVDAFRDFITQCVEVLGSMVIAIDEVDKIESTERAQAFINDIKGLFGVAGCLYLVSISEEAVITFERTGLGIRDAFDSAFDEIVPVEYLDLADSLELLRTRVIGISEPFGFLCHCLSGGLPRELIRSLRRVAEHRKDRQPTSLSAICQELVRDDLAVRAHEFRIVANRLDVQYGSTVLEPLVHLPVDASAKDLLDLTTNLFRRRIPESTPQALARLRKEAAVLAYHSATLRQVFTDELDEGMAKRARDETAFPGSFDQLGRARKAITEDPHLAGLLLDEFRHAWNLPTVSGR